ncbi:hypothetical protein WEI85_25555 [Actinomycetes bacterium KLBMP 9797]
MTTAPEPGRGDAGHQPREEASTVEIPLYRDGQWTPSARTRSPRRTATTSS